VLAFGGRIIEQGEPKYLNSPETPIFTKGRVLYGLHQTARFIRSEDQAVLVEGYMDLVALYQAGIKNVAATLGTALTLDHARIVKRLTRNVLVLFDGDQAGQDAAERSLPLLLQADLYPKGLILPQGMDPDDYVKKYGTEALQILMSEAQDLFVVVLQSWMTGFKGEPADKLKLIDKVKPILAAIPDYRLRDLYIGELASRAGVSIQWLQQSLSLGKSAVPQRVSPSLAAKVPVLAVLGGTNSAAGNSAAASTDELKISLKKAPAAEITMMSLCLKSRANFESFLSENMWEFILSSEVKGILERAHSVYRQEPEKFDRLTSLLVSFVDQPEKLFPSESLLLSQISGDDGDVEEKFLKDAMKKVKVSFLREKLRGLTEELRAQPTSEKMEQLMNVQRDISALNRDK
jgi:DNA primase